MSSRFHRRLLPEGRAKAAAPAAGVFQPWWRPCDEWLQKFQGQPAAGLTVGAGVFIDRHRLVTVQGQQSLDLADALAARAGWIEGLVKKTPGGAAQGEDTLATVGAFACLRQQIRLDPLVKEPFEPNEALLAHLFDSSSKRRESMSPFGKERCFVHIGRNYTALGLLNKAERLKALETNTSDCALN